MDHSRRLLTHLHLPELDQPGVLALDRLQVRV
jgi:hypothetical protein